MGTCLGAFCCLLVGAILRWSVTQFPYSGEGKPPKFGDYEAQRHWMEITTQLPIQDWYVDGPENNLQYWGLDYPPLTAFHSYGLGIFLGTILPESVQLFTSRGYESSEHKYWMRLTVLLSDLLLPALVIFCLVNSAGRTPFPKWVPALLAVMTPPFILIDYAHFQYNCVSLGLTVLAILCLVKNQMSIGAVLFTLAVNHKQMSLYHAVPFFIHMVSTILFKRKDVLTAFRVALVIMSTMGLLWLPFGEGWTDVLHRIFPLKRGVFEDKVGSFWYVLDRVYPIKGRLSDGLVAQLCTVVSGLMLLPGVIHQFGFVLDKKTKPEESEKAFLLSLFNASLNLFLFSFHVHEKSIMLAVLPAVLLFPAYPLETVWFTTVASLSLYPLLLEEGSHLALILVTLIFVITAVQVGAFKNLNQWTILLLLGSLSAYSMLIGGLHLVPPPARLPHLYQSGIAIVSFLHYAFFSLHFHVVQFNLTRGGARATSVVKKQKKKN